MIVSLNPERQVSSHEQPGTTIPLYLSAVYKQSID
jgi:hypothetical protein